MLYNLTNMTANVTSFVDLSRNVSRTGTDGWLFVLIGMAIGLILLFYMLSRGYTAASCIASASFITAILMTLLSIAGLVPMLAVIISFIATGGGVILLLTVD